MQINRSVTTYLKYFNCCKNWYFSDVNFKKRISKSALYDLVILRESSWLYIFVNVSISLVCKSGVEICPEQNFLYFERLKSVLSTNSYGHFHPPRCRCCSSILSLVQFLFSLFSIFIIIYLHKKEQRKIKIEPTIKLNFNIDKSKACCCCCCG